MAGGFEVSIHDRLDPVDATTWERLFSDLPDPLPLIRLVQEVGMDGFEFQSLLIQLDGKPLLLLPLFHLRLDVTTLVDGSMRSVVGLGSRIAPAILRPGVIGVGFVEGECGAVGVEPSASAEVLRQAWNVAMWAVWKLARSGHAKVCLFLNFTNETARWLPAEEFGGFTRIDTYPSGALRLPYTSEEAYLATLSKNMRKDLRRKLRDAEDIRIETTTEPAAYIENIYRLYQQTVARSEMSFGAHRPAYFERICRDVPGAYYTLYFDGDRLLAFNLLVHYGDRLIDKYYGMELEAGREKNLYFVSWMENVRHCIRNRIPIYHAGPGSEGTKSRLGADLTATLTMFRHRNPLIHLLLGRLKSMLAYTPEVAVAPAQIGGRFRET